MNKYIRAALVVGSLFVVGGAQAHGVQTHGVAFTNWNPGDTGCFDRYGYGMKNSCTSSIYVAAPIVKTNDNAAYTFYIDAVHSSTSTTSVTFYSVGFNGTLKKTVSADATNVNGAWSRSAAMTAAEAKDGYVTVLVNLAANRATTLTGVGAYQ